MRIPHLRSRDKANAAVRARTSRSHGEQHGGAAPDSRQGVTLPPLSRVLYLAHAAGGPTVQVTCCLPLIFRAQVKPHISAQSKDINEERGRAVFTQRSSCAWRSLGVNGPCTASRQGAPGRCTVEGCLSRPQYPWVRTTPTLGTV
jgi:hypothetical protein